MESIVAFEFEVHYMGVGVKSTARLALAKIDEVLGG